MRSGNIIDMSARRRHSNENQSERDNAYRPSPSAILDLWKISHRIGELPARVRNAPATLAHEVVFTEVVMEVLARILSEIEEIKEKLK
jgi:hypothetical protein